MPGQSYVELPITFEKGIVTSTESSVLDSGTASEIINWVPEPTGGLRARDRWKKLSNTGLTGDYKVRGFSVLGIGAGPKVVQFTSDSTTGAGNLTPSLSGVTAGNLIVLSITGTNSASDPSGYTKVVSHPGAGDLRIYAKTSAGGTESPTITGTVQGGSVVMYEAANCSVPTLAGDVTDASNAATNPKTISLVASSQRSLCFATYRNFSDTVDFTNLTGGFTLAAEFDAPTGDDSAHFYKSAAGTAISISADAPSASNVVRMILVSFPGKNLDQRSFNLVMSQAVGDVANKNNLTATAGPVLSSGTDTTTYTASTVAAAVSGSPVLVAVTNRKTASTPDIPTLTGTNAWNTTWTQVATVTTTDRRLTVFRGTTQSTTAGAITAAFGVGNTQLSCCLTTMELRASEVESEASLVIQNVTGSDTTGSTASVTLAAFAKTSNSTVLFTCDATTATSNAWTAEAGGNWVEHDDRCASSEGLTVGAFHTRDQDLSPSATMTASNPWAAVGIEVRTLQTANGYRTWYLPTNQLAAGTWTKIGDQICPDTAPLTAIAQGAGYLLWSATGMANIRAWNITTGVLSDITSAVKPGRALVFHKNRFFSAGSADWPSRLFFSDLADATTWGASGFLDVNGDDGEAIEQMLSVENLLLILKTNSAWVLSGSGIESFFLTRLPAGTSAPGHSLAPTPFGTVAAGDREVWNIQGGGAEPLSRPLGAVYDIAGSVSTGYAFDRVYILDTITNAIRVNNLVTGAWFEEYPGTGADKPYVMYGYGGNLYWGPENSTTSVGSFRTGSKSPFPDEVGQATGSSAKTGEKLLFGPGVKYTPRHIFLQLRTSASGTPQTLTVQVWTRTAFKNHTIVPAVDEVKRYRIDVGSFAGADYIAMNFSYPSHTASATPLDIEAIVLGADVERIR